MTERPNPFALSRREFMATTAAAAALNQIPVLGQTGRGDDLAAHVHPDVRIVRDELAREDNAFWSLKLAAETLTPLSEFSAEYFRNHIKDSDAFSDEIDFQDATGKAEEPAGTFPQNEAAACVRAWLDASKQSIGLIEEGIAKDGFQIPEKFLLDFLDNIDSLDSTVFLREVARLITVQCGFYLTSGQEARAAKTVVDLLNMAWMALSGDGFLVHYLVALGVHQMALESMTAVAFHPATARDSLDELRRRLLASRPQADSLARVFRVEFVYLTQKEYSRLRPTDNLPQFVDELIKRNLTLGFDDPDDIFSSREQVARVRAGLLKMLDGHPKPFDAADTIRLYSNIVAIMLKDLGSPWLERRKELAKPWLAEIQSWPAPLSFINNFSFEYAGGEKQEREVTSGEIEDARKALLRIENPVGKHMLHYAGSFDTIRRAYHLGRLRTDIGLLLIACRLFRDKESRLPDRLSELVDAKLIESIPIDPFSGQEVQYDSQRRIVWSFGFDEVDDGGDWDFDAEYPDGKDLVWRIPAAPA